MLKLDTKHRKELKSYGFLDSSIDELNFKTIPKNYIKRRIISYNLSKLYNLSGIPGFYQEEDFKWCFSRTDGFFIPVFDNNGLIQGLSIHLDKPFNENQDLWFSSNNKINGTSSRNYIMKSNIKKETKSIFLTDNFMLGHLISEVLNMPVVAFQNITNSYTILREIEETNIENITFIIRTKHSDNLDYIIRRVFRDLLPLGYNLDLNVISDYKDLFDKNIDANLALQRKVA